MTKEEAGEGLSNDWVDEPEKNNFIVSVEGFQVLLQHGTDEGVDCTRVWWPGLEAAVVVPGLLSEEERNAFASTFYQIFRMGYIQGVLQLRNEIQSSLGLK